MAKQPAMPEGNYEEWLSIMKVGTGVGADWLVLPDPRLIFSAALLVPGAAIGHAVENGIWERVYTALTTFDISRHIADGLTKRLSKRYADSPFPTGQVIIKINALGVEGDGAHPFHDQDTPACPDGDESACPGVQPETDDRDHRGKAVDCGDGALKGGRCLFCGGSQYHRRASTVVNTKPSSTTCHGMSASSLAFHRIMRSRAETESYVYLKD